MFTYEQLKTFWDTAPDDSSYLVSGLGYFGCLRSVEITDIYHEDFVIQENCILVMNVDRRKGIAKANT